MTYYSSWWITSSFNSFLNHDYLLKRNLNLQSCIIYVWWQNWHNPHFISQNKLKALGWTRKKITWMNFKGEEIPSLARLRYFNFLEIRSSQITGSKQDGQPSILLPGMFCWNLVCHRRIFSQSSNKVCFDLLDHTFNSVSSLALWTDLIVEFQDEVKNHKNILWNLWMPSHLSKFNFCFALMIKIFPVTKWLKL